MQHINSFNKGMVRGIDYTISPQASYLYMLNGCLISRDDKGFVVTAIKGTQQIALFDALEVPIGSTVFNGIVYIITHKIVQQEPPKEPKEYICVYSYKGSNGSGWVDTTEIIPNGPDDELVIPQELLGYGRDKLLEVFAKEGYNGSVDLYICDGLSPNAVINTGIDRDGYLTDRLYTEFVDKVQFLLHKSIVKAPEVKTSIGNTGNLKPGTYFFYIRYEDDTLNATPFIKEVGPITIHAGSTESNNAVGVANMDDAKVSKNILFNIVDADPLYRFVSVGVVYYFGIDGILSRENFLIDKSYPLLDGTAHIVFDGDNGLRSLTVEEIVSDNIQYNISETHLQHEDRYLGANWKGGDIDYTYLKEMARRIIPRAVLHSENNFDKVHDENVSENEYMENEIYPFGVSFLIDGRYKTPVFPVCGWMEGLKKDMDCLLVPELPIVENVESPQILALSASVSVDVSSPDGMPILEKGVCWKAGTSLPLPDYNSSKTNEGTGVGEFDTIMSPLTADTVYTYRPYVLTSAGTVVYGEALSLTTDEGIIDITTVLPDAMAGVAYSGGNITSDGGYPVIARGVCWNTSPGPTISNSKTTDGSGLGSYSSEATGLTPGTLYYIRAYATNAVGTSYGNEYSFTTMSGIEDITIGEAYDITTSQAKVSLTVVEEGGGSVDFLYGGICWSTSPNPTIVDSKTEDFSDFGTFICQMTGLTPGVTYYVRGYAINEFGVSYSSQKTFTTLTGGLNVTTLEIDPFYVTDTSANVRGEVQDNNGGGVAEFGICYSLTNANPTTAHSKVVGSGSYASFMCVLRSLISNMGYYARAYAINDIGTFYGEVRSFWTT